MNLYRAILWGSILVIMGEGIILAGFNIQPLDSGIVLGEKTLSVLDEMEQRAFPATYYVEEKPRLDKEEPIAPETPTVQEDTAEGESQIEETATGEIDEVINVLNAAGKGRQGEDITDTVERGASVDSLIRKNKRIYHKDVKKSLDKISETFEE